MFKSNYSYYNRNLSSIRSRPMSHMAGGWAGGLAGGWAGADAAEQPLSDYVIYR